MARQIDANPGAGSDLKEETQKHIQHQLVSSDTPAVPASVAGPKSTRGLNGTPVPQSANEPASSVDLSKPVPLNTRKRSPSEPSSDSEPSSKRSKLSPLAHDDLTAKPVFPSPSDMPATALDKTTWQGFCDIESEPAYFSVILREMGVQDMTVREVLSMDQDFIRENIPQPIYGFILLFHYREFGNDDQAVECPKNVWFANQLPAQNSCATLAMVNTLMNQSADVRLGEHLKQFKEFTNDFSPYQRGEAFASFEFVKKIHNSFAKKMDILEGDKHLHYKVKRAERLKAQVTEKTNPSKKGTRSRRGSAHSADPEDCADSVQENAHHYIAFVPIGNQVWKLDGLDKQPTCVGAFKPEHGETWLECVSETMAALMAAGDDDYGVIALAQSPLCSLRQNASLPINTLSYVDSRLDQLHDVSAPQHWRHIVGADEQPPSPRMLGLEHHVAAHAVPAALQAAIDSEDSLQLLARRSHLVVQANEAAASITMEMLNQAEQEAKATLRRFDSGPVIKKWLEMLAQNGFLEHNLHRFMP